MKVEVYGKKEICWIQLVVRRQYRQDFIFNWIRGDGLGKERKSLKWFLGLFGDWVDREINVGRGVGLWEDERLDLNVLSLAFLRRWGR